METKLDQKQIECLAWRYLELLMDLAWDREADSDYACLQRSLGFEYSAHLGIDVYLKAQQIWNGLKVKSEPEECH